MALLQIEKLGSKILSELTRKRASGWSYRNLQDWLDDTYGVKINHMSIKNYFDRKGLVNQQMINANEDLKAAVQKEVLDTVAQMKKVNKKLWELVEEIETKDTSKKPMHLVSTMNLILKQLEMQEKWINQITVNQSVKAQTQLNMIDTALKVNKIITELADKKYIGLHEDQGVVKIYKEMQQEKEKKETLHS